MDVSEALQIRKSCRAFKPDAVDRDTLLSILNDARCAPSGANTQPWEIYIAGGDPLKEIHQAYLANIKNHVPERCDISRPKGFPKAAGARIKELMAGMALVTENTAKLFAELNRDFFHAPAVIYLCMDKGFDTSWSMFDLGAVSQSIMLAATERGLATMPALELALYPEVLRGKLGIPDNLSVVFGIAIGYEDTQHPINKFKSARRPVSEIAAMKGIG